MSLISDLSDEDLGRHVAEAGADDEARLAELRQWHRRAKVRAQVIWEEWAQAAAEANRIDAAAEGLERRIAGEKFQ